MFQWLSLQKTRAIRLPNVPSIRGLSADEVQQLTAAVTAYRAANPSGPPVLITCCGRTDGAGAQALGVVSAWLWAEATGSRYLHTPFTRMAHAPGSKFEWAAKWDAFFNLGRGEKPVPPNARIIAGEKYLRKPKGWAKRRVVLGSRYFHLREFQTPDALHRLRPILRAKYYASDKSGLAVHRGPPGSLTVAVHVRRGDVTLDEPRRQPSYTHDEPILKTIESVRAVATSLGRACHVNLFSEGPPEMFGAFAAAGCHLHLDGDAFEAFHNMVCADILVQAKSSFSYIAGMISTGAMVHERYHDSPSGPFYRHAPGWIVREDDGTFDPEALRQALLTKPAEENAMSRHMRPLQQLRRWLSSA